MRCCVCSIKPLVEFEVKPERIDKALTVFKQARSMMTFETFVHIVFELGYGDAITFDAQGRPDLNMTDLQFVALAAGMAAVTENRGAMVERFRSDAA